MKYILIFIISFGAYAKESIDNYYNNNLNCEYLLMRLDVVKTEFKEESVVYSLAANSPFSSAPNFICNKLDNKLLKMNSLTERELDLLDLNFGDFQLKTYELILKYGMPKKPDEFELTYIGKKVKVVFHTFNQEVSRISVDIDSVIRMNERLKKITEKMGNLERRFYSFLYPKEQKNLNIESNFKKCSMEMTFLRKDGKRWGYSQDGGIHGDQPGRERFYEFKIDFTKHRYFRHSYMLLKEGVSLKVDGINKGGFFTLFFISSAEAELVDSLAANIGRLCQSL